MHDASRSCPITEALASERSKLAGNFQNPFDLNSVSLEMRPMAIKHALASRYLFYENCDEQAFQIWSRLVKFLNLSHIFYTPKTYRGSGGYNVVGIIKSFRHLGFPFLTSHCNTVLTLPTMPISDGLNNTAISWFSCGPRTPPAGVNENTDTPVLPSDCYRESRSTHSN